LTGTCRIRLPARPTRRTSQWCTGAGTIWVGDRKAAVEEPMVTEPTEMSSTYQPPASIEPSLTYRKPSRIFFPAYADRS
jgi:hypothetical protein